MDSVTFLLGLPRRDIVALLVGFFVAQLVARQIYQLFVYPCFVSPLRHLPGPKDHHFLLGQVVNQIRSGSPNQPYLFWMRRWPRAHLIRYFNVANSDAVLVASLAAHKEILRDKTYSFQKPPFFARLIADIIGLGLVFAEGDEQKSQRKVLLGLFSPSHLKALLPLFRSKARDLSHLIDRTVETDSGIVELMSLYSKITLDIMGDFALGVELDNLNPAGRETEERRSFHNCYPEVFAPAGLGQVLMGINGVVPIRWIPVEANRRFIRANKTIHSQLTVIIHDRIQTVEARKAAGWMDENPNEI